MTSAHLTARRLLLASKGRLATLRRRTVVNPPAYTSVTLSAFAWSPKPDPVKDTMRQSTRVVEILADEIAAASWPGPPRADDTLVWAEGVDTVQDAKPLYDGATLLGYRLWVKGV